MVSASKYGLALLLHRLIFSSGVLILKYKDPNLESVTEAETMSLTSTRLFGETANNSSGARVVRASASEAVALGLIPSRVKPMILRLVFAASLLDAQH